MIFRSVLLIFSFLLSTIVLAEKTPGILPSLDWQKAELKKEMESKVSSVLSAMLKDNEFFIHTTIELATPEMPDFYKQIETKKSADIKSQPRRVRPSVAAEQDPYGYVVFQKLGLEAPLLEDFQEQIALLKDNKPSMFENIWKYNNAVDVFKNIDHVSMAIKITSDIKQEARNQLEKLVKDINFDIPGQSPSIAFEYVDFKLPRVTTDLGSIKPVEELTAFEKMLSFMEKFQLPLGIILGVSMLGFFGFLLLKKYQQILEETAQGGQTLTMENTGGEDEPSATASEGIVGNDSPVPMSQTVLERFISYLENAPRECMSLFRQWVRESNEKQVLGLSYLVEELSNDKISIIVTFLSEEERIKLRNIVQSNLKASELAKAKEFVGAQIRDEILKGEQIDDPELQDMLLALSPKKASQLILTHPETISYLFSKLTAQFLGLILENLPDKQKTSVLSSALATQEPVDFKNIKAILPKYIDVELFSPALEKIKQIIPEASRMTEDTLYQAIAHYGNAQSVRVCALKSFPTKLIPQLPPELLKSTLLDFDSQKRIDFLEVISNEEKEFYLDLFAPEGSKARDIYDLDYERYCLESERMELVAHNKEEIYKNFVSHVRTYIRRDTTHQNKVDSIVTIWANELASKYTATKSQLRAV